MTTASARRARDDRNWYERTEAMLVSSIAHARTPREAAHYQRKLDVLRGAR